MQGYPITPQQNRLWQHAPTLGRATALLRLEGEPDLALLEQSVRALVARHDILRTRLVIPPMRKVPRQVIDADPVIHWGVVEGDPGPVEDLLEKEAARPLDEDGVRPCFTLYRSATGAFLLIGLPGYLCDAWDLSRLHVELASIYDAHVRSASTETAVLAYAQYGAWLDQLREEAEEATGFWNQRHEQGAHPPSPPCDQTDSSGRGRIRQNAEGLLETYRRTGTEIPLEHVLHACWQLCLMRISAADHADVMASDPGRCFEELEAVRGPIARYLPVHLRRQGAETLLDLAKRIGDDYREHIDQWRDYYELRESYLDRSAPFAFSYHRPPGPVAGGSVRFGFADMLVRSEPWSLALEITHADNDRLDLTIDYDRALFGTETVLRWLGYCLRLADAGLSHPEMSADRLPMLAPDEREEMLVAWNEPGVAVAATDVCTRFEACVREDGTRDAVVFEDDAGHETRLDYAELDVRTAALARSLRARGVGPDTRVPLIMDRSADLITAMLGVLRAGGAYCTLEPHFPAERLADMIADLDARLLLTDDAGRDGLPASVAVHTVPALIAEAPVDGPGPRAPIAPEQAAYVLFTSGSTGKPKAVVISHGNLAAYSAGVAARIPFTAGDRFATVSTPAADLGNTMIYPALCGGGCLHVLRESLIGDPAAMGAYFQHHAIDHLKITPSHLTALVQDGNAAVLPAKALVVGGEASRWEMVAMLTALRPELRIFNHYGPTETTVGVVTHPYSGEREPADSLPLGRPIPTARVYLLAPSLAPVPRGTPGEVYIGGETVTRGYHGRPGQTADRFVPDPFASEPGQRLYRTGDRAKHLPGGNIEFLGRLDRQVKVRGYRIELGEIEAALETTPEIGEARVMLRELPHLAGEKALVAHVTADAASFDEPAVREALRRTLPDYMVPMGFVVIAEMPLTPNGKLDTRALAELPLFSAGPSELTAAANPVETVLVRIWSEVLGTDRISTTDTIFSLGGHSLMLIVLNTRISTLFGVDLGIHQLFRNPTIVSIAAAIVENEPAPGSVMAIAEKMVALMDLDRDEQVRRLAERGVTVDADKPVPCLELRLLDADLADDAAARPEETAAIKKLANREGAPLSFDQQRLWLLDQLEGGSTTYNNPAGVGLDGPLSVTVLAACFDEIERRHEVLRTSFAAVKGSPVQHIHPPRRRPMRLVDLSGLDTATREREAKRLMAAEGAAPFDLERGPVWRTALLRLEPEAHVLLLTMHHICSDGWSTGVFIDEVTTLYDAFVRGEPSPLPELPVQYADYATWQRERLGSDRLEADLDFWRDYLKGAGFTPFLRTDRPRPEQQTHAGANVSIALPAALGKALTELGRGREASLFMVLLCAFDIMLHLETGREDLVIGTDLANRDRAELEPLIGFFINQLALRTKLDGAATIGDLIERVKTSTLEAFAHREVPFDQVFKALGLERDLSHAPIFQVKLFLQHVAESRAEAHALRVRHMDAETVSARIDLTLGLWHHPNGAVSGWMNYNTDLFDAPTIQRLAELFSAVAERMCAHPEETLAGFGAQLMEGRKTMSKTETRKRRQRQARGLKKGRHKPIEVDGKALVRMAPFEENGTSVLVIEPREPGLDLPDWCRANAETVQGKLSRHGVVLFRGFGVDNVEVFERFGGSVMGEILEENAEHQPVTEDGKVQVPVAYAADKHLLWHNENTFNHRFPTRILFACADPADSGGQTPIADARRVFARIDPAIRDRFVEKGVMYVRRFSSVLGLSWQTIFRTDDRAVAEQRAREQRFELSWLGEDEARTRAIRPAAINHPVTGEASWTNQAQHWHFACLDPLSREAIAKLYDEDDYPRNCFFGDGSKIEDAMMDEILGVYRETEATFSWQKGDVALLDNLLVAHARNPYTGTRKLLVSLGDMTSYDDVETARNTERSRA